MIKPESAYVAFEAFPRPKGASTHIASMLEALKKTYKPVLLICLGFGDMPSFQEEDGLIIERYKIYHPNMLKRAEGFGEFVYNSLEYWKAELKLCVFRDPWGGYHALKLKKFFKTVFEVNGLPSLELEYTYPDFRKNFTLKNKIEDIEYFCLNNSDKILTVSELTKNFLIQKDVSGDKIKTIPNSVPDFFFSKDGNCEMPEKLKELPPQKRLIGYFGSLHSWQGVEDAIDAFSMTAKSFPDVLMLIITGGHKILKKKLRKRIRKSGMDQQILILHPLTQEALSAIIAKMEFTFAPLKDTWRNTRQGCCPLKIIESMSAGTPVIASGLSCVTPLISHDNNGWLVPAGNVRALSVAFKKLLQDNDLLEKLSVNARETAKKNYNRKLIQKDLNQFFINL